jgi:hypothetical protein
LGKRAAYCNEKRIQGTSQAHPVSHSNAFLAFDGLLEELAEMLFSKTNLPNLICGKYIQVHLLSLFVSLKMKETANYLSTQVAMKDFLEYLAFSSA